MKLLPEENIRPLPCGSVIKAFHPLTLGVIKQGKIVASSGSAEKTIRTHRYQIRFDCQPRKKYWLSSQDICAIEYPAKSGNFIWRESLEEA